MIPYKFLSLKKDTPSSGYWDMGLISDILKDTRFIKDQEHSGGVIVFPARSQADKVKELNKHISTYNYVVLLLTGDEESVFPVEEIKHPKIKIYVMSPKEGRHEKYGKLLTGYPPQIKEHLDNIAPTKDYFFAGQITHPRRDLFYEAIKNLPNGEVIKTEGFTQGLDHATYYKKLQEAKVIPAPSGPVTADTFRLAEALEAGRIPIADNVDKNSTNYWDFFFGQYPFPTISNYRDLPGYIDDQLENYQAKANMIQSWWINYKHELKEQIISDAIELGSDTKKSNITIVIPVSPIKSHPSTKILEDCILTVRHHLPDADIIITFDGVREEQEDRREDYLEFTRRALFLCNTEWNAIPVIFTEHTHQVGMMRAIISNIETPLILYVEGDTGLTPDWEINWDYCLEKILDGTSNMIRFHYQGHMDKEHEHLMLNKKDLLLETIQYSQRPHLASTAYYKRVLDYFSNDAKCFIEDKMHSIVQQDYQKFGRQGWNQHRLHIYYPKDGYLKRSVNFDGREDEPKYDETQTF